MFTRSLFAAALSLLLLSSTVWASAAKDMQAAAKKSKIALMLVTDGKNTDVSALKKTIKDVLKDNNTAVMVEVDRAKPENAELATKYKLAKMAVPMVLVVNPDGVLTSALDGKRAKFESISKVVPSPKKAEILKALSDGNAVFITISRKDMKSLGAVSDSCSLACQKATGKSVCVNIDMNDKKELAYLRELKIDTASAEPVTIVANPQGQIAGKYVGEVKVNDLVASTTKKVGGCCAAKVTGASKVCGPTKK